MGATKVAKGMQARLGDGRYLSWGWRLSRISLRLGKSFLGKEHFTCKEERSCGK